MKSALALLIWGGRVLVISTHNGADSDYAELIAEVRAGRRPYRLLRITFDDALAQGLYRRICLVRGEPWSAAAEAAWAAGIRADYGEDAAEELDCIPRNTGGKYLARSLIEARMQPDIPVLRWAAPQGFVDQPDAEREAALAGWCVEALRPVLGVLPPDVRSCIGLDFGRHRDLTVIWVWLVERDLVRRTACVIELRDCPFRQQEQVLFETVDRLPGFGHGALDAGGNGMYLAEVARQRYGTGAISELRLSEAWYREWMPRYKAAFEDGTVVLPRDAELLDDHRAIEVMRGVPRIPEARSRGESGQRHGDGAIAGALGYYATLQDAGPVDVLSGGPRPGVPAGFGDDGRPGAAVRDTGWGTLAGGLDLGGWT